MECQWVSGSFLLRLNVGRSDHLAPFLGLLRDEPAVVGGRTHKYRGTEVGKPGFQLGIGEPRIDLFVVALGAPIPLTALAS
jgi:hypothetical protein